GRQRDRERDHADDTSPRPVAPVRPHGSIGRRRRMPKLPTFGFEGCHLPTGPRAKRVSRLIVALTTTWLHHAIGLEGEGVPRHPHRRAPIHSFVPVSTT